MINTPISEQIVIAKKVFFGKDDTIYVAASIWYISCDCEHSVNVLTLSCPAQLDATSVFCLNISVAPLLYHKEQWMTVFQQ